MKTPVYCLPFAAGSRFSYQPLVRRLPDSLRFVPLELPGRGFRAAEPALFTIENAVDDVFRQFERATPAEPYALYGHSMGSMVGYLLLHRMQEAGFPLPVRVFFSGRGGPIIPEKERQVHLLPRPQLIEKLAKMGGDLSPLLANERAWALYEPVIRADMAVLDSFVYEDVTRPPLTIPATILIGSHDLYTVDEAALWQREFADPITLHCLDGGHFFIFDHPQTIGQIIAQDLNRTLATGLTLV
ncbi:thioesterase II family protein [Spirosoma validum]|uniref:Thioesterase n=1 Tax=Spirosoma validum TaxID=2771355 RepID=A0A927B2E3_9BACT|nr:alpha/beta fold hydrolase [Spirosoma validum]MBD2754068.1 thioesterase [Spirosoma validum]